MKRDLLVGLVLASVLVGPSVWAGGLAGSPGAEVYGHAWVQWWAAEGWPAWPSGTPLAAGTASWPVIDPLPTWVVAGLARVVGAGVAWNLWTSGAVVLAAVGGGAFARAVGGSGVYGAVGVATMPIFLGSLTSGLTEDYALGIVALALAFLVQASAVTGEGPRRAWAGRDAMVGAALLGLSAWFGLYLAWLGAWAALVIGCVAVARGGGVRMRVTSRWVVAAAVAACLALPAAAPFRERLGGVGHRSGSPPVRVEPLWPLDPWRGADLASFWTPGKVDVGPAFVREHPVYLGYTTIGLALLGGWHPALLGVAVCAAVAPGVHLSWRGEPTSQDNPALRLFRLLPFADRFNHHARVMLLGQLILVALSARGARRLATTWSSRAPFAPWVGGALCVVGVYTETACLSPARVPLPTAPASTPAIYAELAALGPGPLVVVGAAGPGVHPQRVYYDQRAHGRVLAHNPNRPLDGDPRAPGIVVALGDAVPRVEAVRGPPDLRTTDGAAWTAD